MKLELIEKMWSEDCKISELDLSNECVKIPTLHHKYYQLMLAEVMRLKASTSELKILEKDKWLYYSGVMTDSELRDRSWKPLDIKILRTDVDRFIDADRQIIDTRLKLALQDEKVSLLKEIVTSIKQRSFLIKNIIEWKKFESGN